MAVILSILYPRGTEWCIVGAGLNSAKRCDVLEPQDWLQTLVERDGEGAKPRIISSMIDFLPVEPGKHTALYEKMLLEPNIKIVSLLVTEGGYFLSDSKFDPKIPDIAHDIKNKEKGLDPFTVMSCHNVPHNGDVVRSVVVGLADLTDSELAKWIAENVEFPNSMVDRITPATSDDELKFLKDNFDGLEDVAPVFCEPFRQWVLEDRFCSGHPPLEKKGVEFVPDVTPYETMKIRILNGGHASLCYPSALLGVDYVHESMEHPVIGPFLDCLERNEIIPHLFLIPTLKSTGKSFKRDLLTQQSWIPSVLIALMVSVTNQCLLCLLLRSTQERRICGWFGPILCHVVPILPR